MARSLLAGLLLAALCAGSASAQEWSAKCTAAKQVPPLEGDGTAMFSMWSTADGSIAYKLEVEGLDGLTMAHIHLGNDTVNGPPVVILLPTDSAALADGGLPMLDPPVNGTYRAESSFGPEALIGPLAGAGIPDLLELAQTEGVYVNFHTEEYPAGAIRGQLEPVEGLSFEAKLDAASQVPPLTEEEVNGATAKFSLTEGDKGYEWTLEVSDVVNMTMAHIHAGNATTNGPPVVILVPVDGTEKNGNLPMLKTPFTGSKKYKGTFTGKDLMGMTVEEFEAALHYETADSLYVNVHTEEYPAGAIRGQLSFVPPAEPALPPSPEAAPADEPATAPPPEALPVASAAPALRAPLALLVAAALAALLL